MTINRRVDCYIDCWEGSYRTLLAPGELERRYASHCYPFARRLLTINNVDNRGEVLALARAAIERGECDEFVFVDEKLPAALQRCGLTLAEIEPVCHFVDFHLVTVATAQGDYLLHMAGDVELTRSFDWVSDAIARLESNEQYLIANPNFSAYHGLIERESLRFDPPYWVGQGFSDQCFLAPVSHMAAPIYSEWNLASNRYPMTHIGRIFEARVDAYMRNHRLLRLTDSRITYDHKTTAGEGHTHFRGARIARLTHLPLRLAGSLRWRIGGRRPII